MSWAQDEDGNNYGYCNSCGEERQEFEDCCEDGEIVEYDDGDLCDCGHEWERHGMQAGGCIECRCLEVERSAS